MSVWFRSFVRDDRGTISILFGLSIFLVVLTVGIAIDSARAYNISTRIGSALDASALAAAKMLDDDTYSDADVEDRAQRFFAAHFSSTPITGVSVVGPTVRINRNKGEVDVAVEVKVATTFAQLAGVLSFDYPRSTKVTYNEKQIELALVLDITGSMCQPCSKIDGLKSAARTLVANIITPETPAGYVRVAIAPYSAAVNAGPYAATVSGGLSPDNCVVERRGINNDTNVAPSGADSLGVSSGRANGKYYCPRSAVTPLTADTNALTTQINALRTDGWTAGHIGLAWGWYLVSHTWQHIWPADSKPKANHEKVIKAVLLMTDGEFNTSYIPGAGFNSTNLGTLNSSPEQAARLCTRMKAEGVIVYTVAFQAPNAAQALLDGCATSSAHAFQADDNITLVSAFRTIAERLSALRITL